MPIYMFKMTPQLTNDNLILRFISSMEDVSAHQIAKWLKLYASKKGVRYT
jgi:hypothetical protein